MAKTKKEIKKVVKEAQKLEEAIEFVKKSSTSKFVGSVDIDVVLNLKEKQKKENIRGSVSLPYSLGESKKVIVFCEEKDVKTALDSGAVKAGLEDLVDEVVNGFSDFDVVLATPAVMPKIVKAGKALGPKGLMPNPKNGTISPDVAATVKSFIAGRVNYKTTPDQGAIRLKVAKVNMESDQIKSNVLAVMSAIYPEAKKLSSSPFKKVTLSPTMGSGARVDVNDIIQNL
jgi:large subunit ribosomal protein L1